MGHSLVFGRACSPVLGLRPSGEQSRGICSKYDPTHGIGSTLQESGKVGIVVELILLSYFQGQKIEILGDLIHTHHVYHPLSHYT